MKPTCANSTSANAIDTDRKRDVAESACARIRDDDGSVGSGGPWRRTAIGGGRQKATITGIISTSIDDRRRHHGAGKPETADRDHQQRHAGDAAEARAVQREADRHAALLSNQRPSVLVMIAEAGAGPAEREQRIGEIKLPGLADLADQRRRRPPSRQMPASRQLRGPKLRDRLADEDDQQRAEQIEEGRARTKSARPASRAGGAIRRDRRSGRRSRAPSRRSPPESTPRRSASRRSGWSFRRWRCDWKRPTVCSLLIRHARHGPGSCPERHPRLACCDVQRRGCPGHARP